MRYSTQKSKPKNSIKAVGGSGALMFSIVSVKVCIGSSIITTVVGLCMFVRERDVARHHLPIYVQYSSGNTQPTWIHL